MMKFPGHRFKLASDRSPLKEGVFDLWRVDLEPAAESIALLSAMLSIDEKARADRFHFRADKERFIAGRGTLRIIIGDYLGLAPENVRFSYNRFGKPQLAEEGCRMRFNVSHSRRVGVVAVTIDCEVGIDIEFVDPEFDVLSVARGAFPAAEVARLKSLPESLRTAVFFEYWTRKEACLKAMGDGLSSSADQQSAVGAIIGKNEACFRASFGHEVREWSLTSLEIDEDYRAALAAERSIGSVRYCALPEDFRHAADISGSSARSDELHLKNPESNGLFR